MEKHFCYIRTRSYKDFRERNKCVLDSVFDGWLRCSRPCRQPACILPCSLIVIEDGLKQVCRLKQMCKPTGAARKYLTTITDMFLLNYAVSLDEACDGTQKNTQGVWPCKLPIDSLPLQQLASSPALMSYLSKQPRFWFPTAVGDTVQKKRHT